MFTLINTQNTFYKMIETILFDFLELSCIKQTLGSQNKIIDSYQFKPKEQIIILSIIFYIQTLLIKSEE